MSDELQRALDRLADDRSPRLDLAGLDEDEQRMLQMAQLLRGSTPASVDPQFRARLRERVSAAAGRGKISRRAAFLSGLGALAAGIVGGFGVGRIAESQGGIGPKSLVGNQGSWFAVADAAELPDGAVRPFTAGAVQGVLVRQGERIHAVSRICTHMGCGLGYQQSARRLVCPCHGAQFGLDGHSIAGPGGYETALPALPALKVRTSGAKIEVWSVATTPPHTTVPDAAGWM